MHACRVKTNMLNSSVLAFTTVHLAQFLRTPGRKGGGGEGGLCRMPSSAATFSLFFHIRAHFFTFFLFWGPYRVTTAGRGNELHFDLACGVVRALQLVLEH